MNIIDFEIDYFKIPELEDGSEITRFLIGRGFNNAQINELLNQKGETLFTFRKNNKVYGWITAKKKDELLKKNDGSEKKIPLSTNSDNGENGETLVPALGLGFIEDLFGEIENPFIEPGESQLLVRIISSDIFWLSLPWEWSLRDKYLSEKFYVQRSLGISMPKEDWKDYSLSFLTSESYIDENGPMGPVKKQEFYKSMIESTLITNLYDSKNTESAFTDFNFGKKLNVDYLQEIANRDFLNALHLNCHADNEGIFLEEMHDASRTHKLQVSDFFDVLENFSNLKFLFIYACSAAHFSIENDSFIAQLFKLLPKKVEIIAMQFKVGNTIRREDVEAINRFYLTVGEKKNTIEAFISLIDFMREQEGAMVFAPVLYSNYNYNTLQ